MRITRTLSPLLARATTALVMVCATGVPALAQDARLASAEISILPAGTTSPGANEAVDAREWFGQRPWREWTAVTGDWNTGRSWLSDRGVVVTLAETADVSSVRSIENRRTAVARGLFEAAVTADEKTLRIPGSSVSGALQWLPGDNGSTVVGDLQGFSNIDADDVPVLGELWYEQRFGNRVRAKIGRVDANSEFAYVESAGDFLAAAMGFSPSIVAMPSYPNPSSSMTVAVQPVGAIEMRAGVFNGTPEDGRWIDWTTRFAIAQVGSGWAVRGLAGSATAGTWQHRGNENRVDDTSGFYLTAEQTVWSAAERNATAFAHVGVSDSPSPIERHVGGGLAFRGVTRRRPMDVTGVGATWVRFVAGDGDQARELATEVFHRIVLTSSVSVIPDVQVVQTPSGDRTRGRTVAFSCRVRFDF